MSDFLSMGGYGAYVWPSFALTAFILVGLLVQTLAERRRNLRRLEQLRSLRRGRTDSSE
ncbi:heme exporter protein CcmD [Rhodospirillum sp. A1_3_36]|uniref:heme exporter protein CcmD n=1 Tax=Rhodospirillum sp. A1_3_36 TaxID=3391666 RepID=UPI0039A40C3A